MKTGLTDRFGVPMTTRLISGKISSHFHSASILNGSRIVMRTLSLSPVQRAAAPRSLADQRRLQLVTGFEDVKVEGR
jgi:hypothetical protein